MDVIDYFDTPNPLHWLDQIKKSEWNAAQFLYRLLSDGTLGELVGKGVRLLMLTEGEELISFCTLAEKDDVQPTDIGPWIGWVYTCPPHRGHRYAQILLEYAESLARADGAKNIYISTNHIGIYERYGYTFLTVTSDIHGADTRVYTKVL